MQISHMQFWKLN